MVISDLRELVEDFALGVLCTATWIQDQGKGWITFGLAVAYGIYKLMTQRAEHKGKQLDNDLKRKQLEEWNKARVTIENDLADQLKALQEMQTKKLKND